MAKTVILRWTNPAEVGDIDTIEIYRKTGDHTDVSDYEAVQVDIMYGYAAPLSQRFICSSVSTIISDVPTFS